MSLPRVSIGSSSSSWFVPWAAAEPVSAKEGFERVFYAVMSRMRSWLFEMASSVSLGKDGLLMGSGKSNGSEL